MTHYFTNSARNDRRTCINRENWNPRTIFFYNLLCNCILWAKCSNLGKCQIGPMAFQTSLGFWKLREKCIHIVRCWFYEPCSKWNYLADNMQYQPLSDFSKYSKWILVNYGCSTSLVTFTGYKVHNLYLEKVIEIYMFTIFSCFVCSPLEVVKITLLVWNG